MSVDGISTIGAAAVTTVGTLAVTGAALKAVGKASSNMNRGGGGGTRKSKNYNIWGHGKKSKSTLRF